jgi:hypothetical protein
LSQIVSALQRTLPWRRYILWAILGGGVMLIGGMSVSLYRQLQKPQVGLPGYDFGNRWGADLKKGRAVKDLANSFCNERRGKIFTAIKDLTRYFSWCLSITGLFVR